MEIAKIRTTKRQAKHASIRRLIAGTPEKPRLCVCRTIKQVVAQVVDDLNQRSILQITSGSLGLKAKKSEKAKALGMAVAEKLKAMGIEKVVFDRGGYVYHGRIKAVADGAREGGLKF